MVGKHRIGKHCRLTRRRRVGAGPIFIRPKVEKYEILEMRTISWIKGNSMLEFGIFLRNECLFRKVFAGDSSQDCNRKKLKFLAKGLSVKNT